ncbi:LexA family transcriptional regulator [Dehalobacter sp. TeCB1]|uniref:helix-turn-helix domain-containing protein n=1 Tax=Dehalobacter sp. TeCB1 TaxID=1843715 RepID=UPI00083B2157|nr:LexA family transcriptional regulator [Dehalobacter sp. TeCB1]OCZ53822.1 hypothetical protein A7D23_07625 [Dehalobacter sp. TeCB1]
MNLVDSFKTALGIRLKSLRERFGDGKLSQADLAKLLPNVSRANLGRVEIGEVMPSAIFIKDVAEFFNISADWLLTGKEYEISQTFLDPDLQRLIDAYNLLDKENRQALKAYTALLVSHRHLDILEETLKQTRSLDRAPELDVIKEEKSVYLPILGTAAAGMPIMADEFLEGFLPVPAKKIKKNTYIVRAQGESMIDAGIQNGDLVMIIPQPAVEQGEIALVKVDGDVTIKKFYWYDHEVRLRPANKTMEDIVVTDLAKVKVLGKVAGIIPAAEANITMQYEFNGEEDQ